MSFRFTWLNGLWLICPLLAWNLLLGPHMTDPRITSDANSPRGLLLAENITRIVVFVSPLLLPLQMKYIWNKTGLVIYILGTLLYFASWLPLLAAPHSSWSNSPAGLLAPRLIPLLPFLGLALIGENWPYGLISAAFVMLHTWHGVQNLVIPTT